mgnify:CR=1 FL=1
MKGELPNLEATGDVELGAGHVAIAGHVALEEDTRATATTLTSMTRCHSSSSLALTSPTVDITPRFQRLTMSCDSCS